MVIMGSTHRVSLRQCDYLARHRPTVVIGLRKDDIPKARRAVRERRHVLVNVWSPEADEERLSDFVEILAQDAVRGIILSGGDTADLVVRTLEAIGIILEREILPGIPWGRLVGGPADWKPVATKAGGFGRKDSLAVMADYLLGLDSGGE